MEVKSMADRVKETIHLITQIRNLGILDTDPTYLEIKNYLNDWIKCQEKKTMYYDIEFVRYKRKGTLILPWKNTGVAEMTIKKPRK